MTDPSQVPSGRSGKIIGGRVSPYLFGVAVVLEEFGAVIAPGGAGLVISSMAGHMIPAFPPGAEGYRTMIEQSAAGRVGTVDEIANAAALLLGPDGAFITGTHLLLDGGVIAAIRAGRVQLSL